MKNLFVLFLLPLLAFSATADWEMVSMDEQASVIFPGAPQFQEQTGNKVWTAEIDSMSRCMAMVVDFEKFGLDPIQIVEQYSNPNALAEFKNSLLNKMEGATVIAETERKEGGVTCFEFIIHRGEESGALKYMYTQNYFVGTKLYTLTFYQAEQTEGEVAKRFFKSFKVKEM